jgi:hypothetical protein
VSATDHRVAVARLLAQDAAELDRRGWPRAGIIRQAVRLLLEVPDETGNGCPECGAELAQPATGRRRKWCSESCRRRHRP